MILKMIAPLALSAALFADVLSSEAVVVPESDDNAIAESIRDALESGDAAAALRRAVELVPESREEIMSALEALDAARTVWDRHAARWREAHPEWHETLAELGEADDARWRDEVAMARDMAAAARDHAHAIGRGRGHGPEPRPEPAHEHAHADDRHRAHAYAYADDPQPEPRRPHGVEHHLRQAASHLAEAGFPDEAERLRARAMLGAGAVRPRGLPGGPDRVSALADEIAELRDEVRALTDLVRELRRLVETRPRRDAQGTTRGGGGGRGVGGVRSPPGGGRLR